MSHTLFSALEAIADDALTVVLDAALKSSALLLAATAIAFALRHRSAAQRHIVWSMAVAGALAMPLLSRFVPAVHVPLPFESGGATTVLTGSGRAPSTPPEPSAVLRAAGGGELSGVPQRLDPPGARASVERLYHALGIGERERTAATELRTEWLENQTRALVVRQRAVEARIERLEQLASGQVGASLPERRATPPSGVGAEPVPRADASRIALTVVGSDGRTRPDAAGRLRPGAAGRLQPDAAGLITAREASSGRVPSADGPVGAALAGLSLPGALLALWVVGMLVVLSTLIVGMARLRWIAHRTTPITSGPLCGAARRVGRRLRLDRMPVILQGDDTAIPMTWGSRRPYLLLPAGAEAWEDWRLEAVLLHELGHLGRRDYLSQMAAHLTCAAYWFNPLVWMAAQQMRIEREHACDDLVVSAGHDASAYARDLLRLARSFRSRGRPDAVALAMARPAHLRRRLLAILDETRSRHPVTPGGVIGVGTVATAVALAIATLTPAGALAGEEPAARETADPSAVSPVEAEASTPAITPGTDEASFGRLEVPPVMPRPVQEATVLCGPADGDARRRASLTDDGVRTVEAEFGDCRSSVRIEGQIEFNDDFSAIARLSSGALLRMEVARAGSRRRLEVRPGSGGRPDYAWSIDGRTQAFDDAAERWLASALLDLFRSSSYMARERGAWILTQQGPGGILAEVERMSADHAQAMYLTILLERGELTSSQVRGVIEVAGREIESDHSLGEVLIATAAGYSFDAATRAAFLEAATSLESDHQQGRVFQTALSRGDLTAENLDALLQSAAGSIDSDHTLGEILIELASRYPLEPQLREPFLDAAATLESDHTAGRVYGVLLQQSGLRPAELAAVLDAATGIDSDHTLGELLRSATRHDLSDSALRGAFLRAAATIESDHTRGSVYREALSLDGLNADEMATILEAVGEIGSDHELSTVLIEVADRGLAGATLQRSFLRAATRIESDHAMSEALRAFLRMDGVGEAEQIGLLRVAPAIESDHSLAELLIEFAERYSVQGAVREALLDALDGIESRHAHGRVSSAIVDR